jgi:FKBP-type peptidyl-prolyl cis-trans isomerase FklB
MSKSNSYLKKIKDLAAKNLVDGAAFLKQNAEREQVIVLPSGLQYEIEQEGTGKIPNRKDKVLCHYKGKLLNDEVFDNSYKRKRPEAFFVHELIKGWQEALTLMPVGSKWILYVPHHLAYGFEALTPTSGGNCTLIFKMELISIL